MSDTREQAVLVLPPVTITSGNLTSYNVVEPTPGVDPDVWNPATAYTEGALATLVATHSIYKRAIAGTTATTPDTDSKNWTRAGSTNAWRQFDSVLGSQTRRAGFIQFTAKPNQVITSLALLNVDGVSVDVVMTDPSGDTWSRHESLVSNAGINSWHAWHFRPVKRKRQVLLLDVPSYSDASFIVTVNAGSGTAGVGMFLMSYGQSFGKGVQYGASVGNINYSSIDFDFAGNPTIVKRASAKRAKFSIPIDNTELDFVQEFLASLGPTFCLWVGYRGYAATVIAGIYTDFDILISHPTESDCDIEIKGFV